MLPPGEYKQGAILPFYPITLGLGTIHSSFLPVKQKSELVAVAVVVANCCCQWQLGLKRCRHDHGRNIASASAHLV